MTSWHRFVSGTSEELVGWQLNWLVTPQGAGWTTQSLQHIT